MRVVIQLKAVIFTSVIVIYIYSFIYPLQNTCPFRAVVNFSANLQNGEKEGKEKKRNKHVRKYCSSISHYISYLQACSQENLFNGISWQRHHKISRIWIVNHCQIAVSRVYPIIKVIYSFQLPAIHLFIRSNDGK